ncbi:MAG: efflux RND transporter periplasmic adaptor subunit [Calditrichota bacterium]
MKSKTIFTLLLVLLVVSIGINIRFLSNRGTGAPDRAELKPTKQLWTCGMHPQVIQDHPGNCPICGMKLTPLNSSQGLSASSNGTVISVDPAIVQNIGVRTAKVERRSLRRTVRANGVVVTDETKESLVNLKYMGWIEQLYVSQTGQQVIKGQKLFDIYSPELITAMQEYLLAYNAPLHKADSVADDPVLAAARNKLRNWNVTEEQIAALETAGIPPRKVTVFCPANGIVMTKNITEGGAVMAGTDLYRIADLTDIWVQAEIYEYELPWIEIGQAARVTAPHDPAIHYEAKINYIYPYLNPDTRTATVRFTLTNPALSLKPDMFVDVDIITRPLDDVIAVPHEAVMRSGRRDLVFVALGGGRFEPREVKIGLEADSSFYEIHSGLLEGESVVISAQFLLDSETQLQEALMKLMAGESSTTPPPVKATSRDSSNKHLAEGPTMSQLYSADQLYWCPMHHEIVSPDKDADCPICEMPLKEIPPTDLKALRDAHPYGCPMDPIIVAEKDKDKPCPICEMRLKPVEPIQK